MKLRVLILSVVAFFSMNQAQAQRTLDVETTQQEQDQWCWAATSKCLMGYFHKSFSQCEIADYARTRISWWDFGSVNCCADATQGCNYWNYMYGTDGSIVDILEHFAGIVTMPYNDNLTYEQTIEQIDADKPFIFRWGWLSGGGHFLVMHGYDGEYVDYMDPWFGEGKKISLFSWVVADGNHEWTHTLPITQLNPAKEAINADLAIQPNPATDEIRIPASTLLDTYNYAEVYDLLGNLLSKYSIAPNTEFVAPVADLAAGTYLLKLAGNPGSRVLRFVKL